MLHIKTQYLMGSTNNLVNNVVHVSCILWLWGELSNVFSCSLVHLVQPRTSFKLKKISAHTSTDNVKICIN